MTLRSFLYAFAIAVAVGVIAGAINGWMVGAFEEFLAAEHQRYRDTPVFLKRYVRVRTLPFALPLGVGGWFALRLIRRWTEAHGYWLIPAFVVGAFLGWFAANQVGALVAEEWPPVRGPILLVPAILFAAIPAIKIFRDH